MLLCACLADPCLCFDPSALPNKGLIAARDPGGRFFLTIIHVGLRPVTQR